MLLLPIPILWAALHQSGHLNYFENRTIDWRFYHRGELAAPVKVVYVDIDSKALSQIGGFPWSRLYFSRVASALIEHGGAKAVGIDVVFSQSGMSESMDVRRMIAGNNEFAKYLIKHPPVVLAAAYGGQRFVDRHDRVTTRALYRVAKDVRQLHTVEPPELPVFVMNANQDNPLLWSPPFVGLIDTIGEKDTRRVPAYAPAQGGAIYRHMAIELARLYWGLPSEGIKYKSDRIELCRANGEVHAVIPLIDQQDVEVNWFSAWLSRHNPRISIADVFGYAELLKSDDADEKEAARTFFAEFSEGAFKDSIVLIGPVDPLQQDLGPSPLDDTLVPKVGVHGNLVKTIISRFYLKRLPRLAEHGIIFGLTAVISIFAAAGGTKGLRSKLAAALLIVAYVFLGFRLFTDHHMVLPLAAPIGAVFTTSFTAIIWQLIEEEKAKGRIKGMFGAYVSPDLVNRMVEAEEDPQLGGHEEEITAYFSDIQGFSTFSEKLTPARLVELMNEYLTACTDIVQEEGGTLDKYIGDAVVAMFGAPVPLKDHALRACVAAQRVQKRISELRAKWESEGDKWPPIVWRMQSRIGLNSGRATIGNMGSRTRFNYTMMGDNVNLAARMESGAKQYGVYTMVTETTKLACEQHGADRLIFRYLDKIVVKGRTIPVPVYEVVGLKEDIAPQTQDCLRVFGEGIARYLAQDWDGAEKLFGQSAELEPNQPGKTPGVEGNPSLTLITRCRYMRNHPPGADWDGVYEMKEK